MVGISASRTRLAVVPEASWGVIPATPAFKNLRMTSETLAAEKQTAVSNEIRPDRNVPDVIQVGRMAQGSIEAELSYGTFDALLASALYGSWTTDVLKNGVLQSSFAIEKTFDRNVGADEFHRYSGVVVNTLGLSVTAAQLVTASLGVMGKGVSRATSAITGATYQDANTEDVMSAATDFADMTVTGLGSAPAIQSIQLNTTNNLRQRQVVGSLDSAGLGEGRFEASGSINVYFEEGELYQAFLDHGEFALAFTLGTEAGKRYKFELPRCKIMTMPITAGGNDQDVMANLTFQALVDATLGGTLRITRGV